MGSFKLHSHVPQTCILFFIIYVPISSIFGLPLDQMTNLLNSSSNLTIFPLFSIPAPALSCFQGYLLSCMFQSLRWFYSSYYVIYLYSNTLSDPSMILFMEHHPVPISWMQYFSHTTLRILIIAFPVLSTSISFEIIIPLTSNHSPPPN